MPAPWASNYLWHRITVSRVPSLMSEVSQWAAVVLLELLQLSSGQQGSAPLTEFLGEEGAHGRPPSLEAAVEWGWNPMFTLSSGNYRKHSSRVHCIIVFAVAVGGAQRGCRESMVWEALMRGEKLHYGPQKYLTNAFLRELLWSLLKGIIFLVSKHLQKVVWPSVSRYQLTGAAMQCP